MKEKVSIKGNYLAQYLLWEAMNRLKTIEMNKTIKLLPPMMPNFIFQEMPTVKREDGFDPDRGKIPITDLTEAEAEEFGELMKKTFIKHWRNKKAQL